MAIWDGFTIAGLLAVVAVVAVLIGVCLKQGCGLPHQH